MRNLNVHNLLKLLNELCNELSKSYFINEGGCCFVTYLIANHLERLGIKYKLLIFDDTIKNLKEIQNEISFKSKNFKVKDTVIGNGTCLHYTLYIDGAGALNSSEFSDCYKYCIKNINSNHIKWIYKFGNWNEIYKRKNNKFIRNTFKTFFNNL